MKEDGVDRACSAHGSDETFLQFLQIWFKSLKGRDHVQDRDVGGWIEL
jgi:hypothetical protein